MDEQNRSQYEARRFEFLVEKERFLNHIDCAKKTTERASVLRSNLESLSQELEFIKADTLMIKEQLNILAIRYELKPISINP